MKHRMNAFTEDAPGTIDATAMAESIATKKISVTDALEAAIARVEKVNPALNAICASSKCRKKI